MTERHETARRQLVSPALRDLVLLVVLGALCFVLASWSGAFDEVAEWTQRHDELELDRLVVVAAGVVLLFSCFSWRRYLELRSEAVELEVVRRDLALADERYRSLFEYNPNAVFSVDLAARITSANRAGEQLTRRSEAELLSMSITDVVAPSSLENAMASFARALDREPQHISTRVVTGQGQLVDIEATGLPIVIDDQVVGVYVIAADIGARKRLEGDLMRAQVAAEQASGAKDLLLANVSHEVRTPLTGLLGNLELLQDTELDPVQTRFVDTMQRSGDRLLDLVNEILDYTRLEAGKVVLATVPFDLGLIVSDVAALVGQPAENKGLYFKRRIDPALPAELIGDPARLAQVLTILLDNAVKFTDDGWVRLAVSVVRRERGRARIRFEVSDSGVGMPTRHRDQLFQAFSQADASMTRRYGGTGLGLTRCHQLITMMGGSIAVDSTPGLGSAFTFAITLPEVAEVTDPSDGGVTRHRAGNAVDASDSGSMPYS